MGDIQITKPLGNVQKQDGLQQLNETCGTAANTKNSFHCLCCWLGGSGSAAWILLGLGGSPVHWWMCMIMAQHTSNNYDPACHWFWLLVDAEQVLEVNVIALCVTAGRLHFWWMRVKYRSQHRPATHLDTLQYTP